MRDTWKSEALRTPFLMLVLLLAPVGLVLVAGALAGTITSDLDKALLGWGALSLGVALVLYLAFRYVIRHAGAQPQPAPPTTPQAAPSTPPQPEPPQATWTTGAGDGESAGPSQWATSPSE